MLCTLDCHSSQRCIRLRVLRTLFFHEVQEYPSMSFSTRRKAFAVEKRLSFRHAGRGNGSNAAAYNAYHYPGPMGLYQQPFYNRRYLHAFVINYKNLYLESQIFSEFRFFPLFRKLTSFLSLGCFAFKWVTHVQDYM